MNKDYNIYHGDIRLAKIPLEDAESLIRSFEDTWIYIKSNTSLIKEDCSLSELTTHYYKLKVKSVSISLDFIYIYGSEDDDRLIINKEGIIQSECSAANDEIKLIVKDKDAINEIYVRKYSLRIDNRFEEILQSNSNLIITEGKTDWKHLKNALEKLRERGLFLDLEIDFFEYEDKPKMGEDILLNIRNYNSYFSNGYLKIFVFDSDVHKINKEHEGMEYKFIDNNVYSMILPIPEHRKDTPLISIEHYYTDSELATVDCHGRRLFVANEFDSNTGKHNNLENVYSLGVDSKTELNKIIDNKVFKLKHPVVEKSEIHEAKDKDSIALSKNKFAENILNKVHPFGDFSVNCFFDFFEIISKIYKIYKTKDDNAKEISKGVYLEHLGSGFQELSLHCSMPNNMAIKIKENNKLSIEMDIDESSESVIILIHYGLTECLCQIPITISGDLIDFFIAKSENHFNRIYLNVYDENQVPISSKEILSKDDSSFMFNRILSKRLQRMSLYLLAKYRISH